MAGAHNSEAAAPMKMLLRVMRLWWGVGINAVSPPFTMRAGTALLSLPLKRPHPTFVETTLPQFGRLVKVPAFVEMHDQY
jgi:hypothetical protein